MIRKPHHYGKTPAPVLEKSHLLTRQCGLNYVVHGIGVQVEPSESVTIWSQALPKYRLRLPI